MIPVALSRRRSRAKVILMVLVAAGGAATAGAWPVPMAGGWLSFMPAAPRLAPGYWRDPSALTARVAALEAGGTAAIVNAAPSLADLVIHGNHALGTRDIRDAIAIAVPVNADTTLPALAADRALGLYRDRGFLRARAAASYRPARDGRPDAADARSRDVAVPLVLDLVIEEGAPARVDSLDLVGCRALAPGRVRRELALRPGRAVTGAKIAADADRILSFYEEEGYPFAQVSAGSFRLSDRGDRLSFAYRVIEGARVRVKGLELGGAGVTRPLLVEREMRLERGAIYRQSHIDLGRERLVRSGLFGEVGDIALRPSAGGREVTLLLAVVPAATNSAEGAVGYVPARNGSGSGYFTGQLDLALGNIAGTGRKAEVHWRRLAPGSASWRLSYLEPWAAGLPLSAGGELRQEVRDSTYTTRGVELRFVLPVSFSLDAELSAFRERTTTGARGFGFVETSRRTGVGGAVSFDRRDRVVNPRRGGWFRLEGGWAGRAVHEEVTGAADSTATEAAHETTGALAFGWYHPAGGAWVLAMEGEYHEVRAGHADIPYYELSFIGGARGPRGYAEDQFAGARTGRVSAEYRYHLTPRSRFHLFTDFGYDAWRGASATHWGYGAGLNLESRLGLVGLDLGLPVGGGLADGKLHLRLRQEW